MAPEIVKYVSHVEKQKKKALADLERAKRAILRLDEKLADPEKNFNYENGRGAKKVTRLFSGEAAPKRETKVILRKQETEPDEIQAPVKKETSNFLDF